MDVSPMSGRCSSDFSIERILSEDSGRSREEAPSWLCCTRYRPPRLPRSTSSACRARRSGRHARVPFTAAQASALEAAYARAPYLAPPALRALAAALQLRDDRIKIWFQNRRARERREKSANITPPLEVTLPPTSRIPQSATWIPQTNTTHFLPVESNAVSAHENIEIHGVPYDLTVTSLQSSLYSETMRGSPPGNNRSETPLDVESIDE
ncbi:homeobox protein MSX-1-like [Plodia interpunctella]|uniref:homeobox protein MSX-1-like n=1 Tax=Plodia interpunctella TaxID=58824 RepID=UPI0023678841|nr:homeobox protein MSX-1-like [Plodia interpunctella]